MGEPVRTFRRDRVEMMVSLFKGGKSTWIISQVMRINEADVYNTLAREREKRGRS